MGNKIADSRFRIAGGHSAMKVSWPVVGVRPTDRSPVQILRPHPRPTIINLFQQLWENGHTMVLITHDPSIAKRTNRIVQMQDGRIVEDSAA